MLQPSPGPAYLGTIATQVVTTQTETRFPD